MRKIITALTIGTILSFLFMAAPAQAAAQQQPVCGAVGGTNFCTYKWEGVTVEHFRDIGRNEVWANIASDGTYKGEVWLDFSTDGGKTWESFIAKSTTGQTGRIDDRITAGVWRACGSAKGSSVGCTQTWL